MTPQEVAARYRAGASVPALAAHLSVRTGEVYSILARQGEPVRHYRIESRLRSGALTDRDAAALSKLGYTVEEIANLGSAEALEVPKTSPPPPEPPPPPLQGRPSGIPDLDELRRNGITMTSQQMAGFYGVHRSTIYRWLQKAGADSKDGLVDTVMGISSGQAVNWAVARKVLAMRGDGRTFQAIGDVLGVTRQRAYQLYANTLHNLGVTKDETSVLQRKILDVDEALGIGLESSTERGEEQ